VKLDSKMTDSEKLTEIYLVLKTIQGYLQGSTEGLIKRLDSIDTRLEELHKSKRKKNDNQS